MASAALRDLLQRLVAASEPVILTPEERALLCEHLTALRPAKPLPLGPQRGPTTSSTPRSDLSGAGNQPPDTQNLSPLVSRLVQEHDALALARDGALANGLQALLSALDQTKLSKNDALSLAQVLLPGGRRFRSGTEALSAVKARLMQRYRDAVRTATLAGEE